MALTLTKRKEEIYNFIVKYKEDNGFPPSIREIGNHVNLKSTSSVHQPLASLEDLGYIKIHRDVPRGIQILSKTEE